MMFYDITFKKNPPGILPEATTNITLPLADPVYDKRFVQTGQSVLRQYQKTRPKDKHHPYQQ